MRHNLHCLGVTSAKLTLPVVLCLAALPANADPLVVVYTVNSTADRVDMTPGDGICKDGSGECTLRGAIQEANARAGADTIILPAGTYTLTLGGTPEDAALTGDLDITDSLTILGADAATTIIDATGLGDRVFHIPSSFVPKAVSFTDVTIMGGTATDAGSGVFLSGAAGGGILNEGPGSAITIADSVVTENTAAGGALSDGQGGGIADVGGNWTIVNTEITNNHALGGESAAGRGGGFFGVTGLLGNATALLIDSTIAGNQAVGGNDLSGLGLSGVGEGGGIYNDGVTWTAVGSTTIDGNVAKGGLGSAGSSLPGGNASGGGIYDAAGAWTFTLIPGSTISRNEAVGGDGDDGGDAKGGGIFSNGGDFEFENNTISSNLAVGGDFVGVAGIGGAATGGGVYAANFATFDFDYVTIAENDATGGSGATGAAGGVFSDDFLAGVTILHSTIVASNTASSANPDIGDAFGAGFISTGFNLIGNVGTTPIAPAAGDLIGTTVTPIDPLLGPLQNNGGPTETHELLSGSPAIDAANPASFPPFDQHGVSRPIDGLGFGVALPDIGSYEAGGQQGPDANVVPEPASLFIWTVLGIGAAAVVSRLRQDGDNIFFSKANLEGNTSAWIARTREG